MNELPRGTTGLARGAWRGQTGGMNDAWTRRLLLGGVIGPIVFVAGFLVIGAVRPDYDAARTFVSQLSLTDQGWQQIANFVVSGALIIGFAVGLRRVLPGSRWGPILIGAAGVGLVLSGIFLTDPALGYPPGTPEGFPATNSWHATVHYVAALLVFAGLPAAAFVLARRFRAEGNRGWATYSMLTAVGMLAAYVLAISGPMGADALLGVAGVLQRVSAVIGLGWVGQLAWRLWRVRGT